MTVTYTARHTELTPKVEKYCERRMASLEKLLGYPLEAHLTLSVEKYRNKVEINVKTKGATLNAVSETQDVSSSLGAAFDNIERRAKKEKDKLRERKRRTVKEAAPPEGDQETQRRVIRSRKFAMKPMSVEEATILLESSRDEVLVFRTSDTETWAVLYWRKDGNFGLIEPK
ncbi:MAG: ribosome hibernation-promoting factor, HPF/YfiA family [Candidatus Aminicenantaceae bacterium]